VELHHIAQPTTALKQLFIRKPLVMALGGGMMAYRAATGYHPEMPAHPVTALSAAARNVQPQQHQRQ
jgi:hypothetical protein